MSRTIRFFDTTLRDGEQTPGVNMNLEEKMGIARQLERMGVDVIEAGFAAASPATFIQLARFPRQYANLLYAASHAL